MSRLLIAYTGGASEDVRLAVDDGAGWTFETVDWAGITDALPSMAVGANGTIHIAYRHRDGELRHAWRDAVDQDCDGTPGE